MNTSRNLTAATALMFVMAAGCKKDPVSETRLTGAPVPGPQRDMLGGAGQPPTTISLSTNDTEFVTKAAQGGLLEVQMGNTANERTKDPAVRQFAQLLIDDHAKANEELQLLATKKGAVLPAFLDEKHGKMIDDLSRFSGAKFDSEFARAMVDDHHNDVAQFERAAKEVNDAEIRAWAAKTLPTLQGHLAMAKDLKAKTAR